MMKRTAAMLTMFMALTCLTALALGPLPVRADDRTYQCVCKGATNDGGSTGQYCLPKGDQKGAVKKVAVTQSYMQNCMQQTSARNCFCYKFKNYLGDNVCQSWQGIEKIYSSKTGWECSLQP